MRTLGIFLVLLVMAPVLIVILVKIFLLLYENYFEKLIADNKCLKFIIPLNSILIIISVILAIYIININSKVDVLVKEQNCNCNDAYIYELRQEIHDLRQEIHDLKKMIEEENKWIINSSYHYNSLNDEDKVNTNITFSLKTMSQDAEVYLIITNKDDITDVNNVLLDNDGSLDFSKDTELDINKNYKIEVRSEGSSGIIEEELFDLNLLENLLENRLSRLSVYYSQTDDLYHLSLTNHCKSLTELKIRKIELKKFVNGQLLEIVDITNDVNIYDNNAYISSEVVDYSFTYDQSEYLEISLTITDNSGRTLITNRVQVSN